MYVAAVHNHIGDKAMRNLTVADIHTYYVIAGTTPVLVHNEGGGPIPYGFDSEESYLGFVESLNNGLSSAGYGGATAAFQGSSVTGFGYSSGAAFGSHSDYDIAIGGEDIFNAAKGAGIGLRSGGTRTGPLTSSQLKTLGLGDLADSLSVQADREVHFMVYNNIDSAVGRSPSIVVPRGPAC